MKRPVSLEEFNSMTKQEQDSVIDELREELGGTKIDMSLWTREDVANWWKNKQDMDRAGAASIELLMSRFFLALLSCSTQCSSEDFMQKAIVALEILSGLARVRWVDDYLPQGEDDDGGKITLN